MKDTVRNDNVLTVLLMRGADVARSFTLSISTLTRLGLTLLIASLLTVVSIGFSIWSYSRSLRADLSHVLFLEKEIASRDLQISELKSRLPSDGAAGEIAPEAPSAPFIFLPENAPRAVSLERFNLSWSGSRLRVRLSLSNQQADSEVSIRILAFAQLKNGIWIEPSSAITLDGTTIFYNAKSIPIEVVENLKSKQIDLGPFANRTDVSRVGVYIFDDQMRVIASRIEDTPRYIPPPPRPAPIVNEPISPEPLPVESTAPTIDESGE